MQHSDKQKRLRIFFTGVGGQGTLTATTLLARTALDAGQDVVAGEVHGMAQRGGAVTTVVRLGDSVASMVADKGSVDYLVSFEKVEALRNIEFLKDGGALLVNDEFIKPLPVATGAVQAPSGVVESLEQAGAVLVPAKALAKEAGSVKAVNVVLLGALSTKLNYDEATWLSVIESRVPAKFKDVNIAAFKLGRKFVEECSA